jgi:NAD(P)-dependent dehydrogenase (short-subunit alcohol dehydrogenase family)
VRLERRNLSARASLILHRRASARRQARPSTPRGSPDAPIEAEEVAKFGQQSAMKRAAQPEEIAPAFVFLAAPSCSSYITGEILPIIGGYSGG